MKTVKITEGLKAQLNEGNGQKALQLYRQALRLFGWSQREIEQQARLTIQGLWKHLKSSPQSKEWKSYFPDFNDNGFEDDYSERLETMIYNGLIYDIKAFEALVKEMDEEYGQEYLEDYCGFAFEPVKNTETVYEEGFFIADPDDPDNEKGHYLDIVGPKVKVSVTEIR